MTDIQDLRSRIREKPDDAGAIQQAAVLADRCGRRSGRVRGCDVRPAFLFRSRDLRSSMSRPRVRRSQPCRRAPNATPPRVPRRWRRSRRLSAATRRQRAACADQWRRTGAEGQGGVRSRQADGFERQERHGFRTSGLVWSVDRGAAPIARAPCGRRSPPVSSTTSGASRTPTSLRMYFTAQSAISLDQSRAPIQSQ